MIVNLVFSISIHAGGKIFMVLQIYVLHWHLQCFVKAYGMGPEPEQRHKAIKWSNEWEEHLHLALDLKSFCECFGWRIDYMHIQVQILKPVCTYFMYVWNNVPFVFK